MKYKILIMTMLTIITNVVAQEKSDGTFVFINDSIKVDAECLHRIEGQSNVWEIDKDKDTLVFSLKSKNVQPSTYSSNYTNIRFKDKTGIHYDNKIPNLKGSGNFYTSATLVVTADYLPNKIMCNDKVIAEIRGREITYQKYSKPDKKVYVVGDKIELNLDKDKGNHAVSKIQTYVKIGQNKSIELKDGIISNQCLNGKDSILCDVKISITYDDNITEEVWCKSIKIKESPNEDKTCIYVCMIIAVILIISASVLLMHRKSMQKRQTSVDDRGNNEIQDELKEKIKKVKKEYKDLLEYDECLNAKIENITKALNCEDAKIDELAVDLEKLIIDLEKLNSNFIGFLKDKIKFLNSKLKSEEESAKEKIRAIEIEKQELEGTIQSLQNKVEASTSDYNSKRDLRNKIEELIIEKNRLSVLKKETDRKLAGAKKQKILLETQISEKNNKISEISRNQEETELNLRIAKNNILTLQEKIKSYSRQTYYLYTVDDTLLAVDNSLKTLFDGVQDESLMKRLAQPIISGTAGLDGGLESLFTEWKNTVFDNQNKFFGDSVLNMTDESVKEKLTEFLEQLALRDSFGKLARLYLMTNVGWINMKLVAVGFNVDSIQTLFVRFKNLFSLFGIEIDYPHLFVDQFNPSIHKDNMRCEIFNYFEPSEDLIAQLKKRENENLIVDVTRIGIPNSKNPSRRNAMVSLPSF